MPRAKNYTYRNFYAYHRLYYVIKNYYNRFPILKAFFGKWKTHIVNFIPKHLTNILRKYASVKFK